MVFSQQFSFSLSTFDSDHRMAIFAEINSDPFEGRKKISVYCAGLLHRVSARFSKQR
jgi:hypothetical protein